MLAAPVSAHEAAADFLSEPSAADYTAAQRTLEPIIARLEAGKPKEAFELISSQSEIYATKATEINLLAGQIGTVYDIYGPVEKCIATERAHASELRIKYTYMCQHSDLLIRWDFSVDHVAKGWIVTNFRFSDTF